MTNKTNMLFRQESRSYAVELGTSLGKRIGKMKIDFFEDHFSSKRMMADTLGINYQTLLDVCACRGSAKNINEISFAIL